MYTQSEASPNTRAAYRGNYGGGCCGPPKKQKSSSKEEAIPNIADEATWETWKDMTYANMDEDLKKDLSYNFAHYMNCKLNRFKF